MKPFYPLLLLLLLFACRKPLPENQKMELRSNWEFSKADMETWLPAKVPGLVHLDLLKNKLIDAPYRDDNETKLRWIEEENWQYRCEFELNQSQLSYQQIEIEFEGLDTYAEVFLNGKKIIQAKNMFRSWRHEIKKLLQPGKNELLLKFESVLLHNREKARNYPHQLPAGNEAEDIADKVSPFTRKAAYHFGWDWGPRFVSAGIWKKVKFHFWNKARINQVYTQTEEIRDGQARMSSQLEIEALEAGQYKLFLGDTILSLNLNAGINFLKHPFTVMQPKLWWCNGLGEAHLYKQAIELWQKGQLLDSTCNRYGIRTIELIEKKDSIGTSFYFKLNGRPVFMKGANYIPQDLFVPRVKEQQYIDLIQAVKEANMNMLRVWGGGIYEQDIFYDLCDQMGILVWQDFMFAGSLYPNDPEFISNITEEISQNVKRLRQHPSLALWCGNNEIEVAWKNWGWQKQYQYSKQDSAEIWTYYQSIFKKLIPKLLYELDPKRNYSSSSPQSNWGKAENFKHSSMHYWGVWHGKESFEAFENNVGRFMVEYGFQSFPELSTLAQSIHQDSLFLESTLMQKRQKSYIGNDLITKHIVQYFQSPADFAEFVELSQKTQALALSMAIKAHREREGHCMGSLFWQLNDCWPGPSWSVLDYYGKKKKAYFSVQEAFAN